MRCLRKATTLLSVLAGCASVLAYPQANKAAKQGLSPGPKGSIIDGDYRVPVTWLDDSTARPGKLTAGDFARLLRVQGRDRYYEMHLPEGYNSTHAYPAVLVLHGGGGFASFMRYQTGMDELADREKFIVVYPAGSHQLFKDRFLQWNAGVEPKNAKQRKVDDVAYISAVLDDLKNYVHLDEKRVFAAGMSAGAHMTFLLAAKLPDRIAAIGTVGGQRGVGQYAPIPPRPIPLIHFHGKQDTWALYGGGNSSPSKSAFKQYKILPVTTAIRSWVKHNHAASKPEVIRVGDAIRYEYVAGDNGADVVYWELLDGGHTWPGGKRSRVEKFAGVGHVNTDINASEQMWDFFKRHPLK